MKVETLNLFGGKMPKERNGKYLFRDRFWNLVVGKHLASLAASVILCFMDPYVLILVVPSLLVGIIGGAILPIWVLFLTLVAINFLYGFWPQRWYNPIPFEEELFINFTLVLGVIISKMIWGLGGWLNFFLLLFLWPAGVVSVYLGSYCYGRRKKV